MGRGYSRRDDPVVAGALLTWVMSETSPRAVTHAATCARVEQSSLCRILATCDCAVALADDQRGGDLGIGAALRHQDGHLPLASSQPA